MPAEYIIGIDIGTQGTKAILCDAKGTRHATAFVKSKLHRPKEGVVEEDPEEQLKAVCTVIRQCMKASRLDSGEIAALALDGQMAGVIGVGSDGRAVTPYDSWLDTRCAPYIQQMQQRAGSEIIRLTGGPASFNHGPKILWWKHERAQVYRQIHAFVQPGGYAAMRLCGLEGRDAFIDTTYLHFSGFADNTHAQWSDALCATFEVDPHRLPNIVPPTRIMGELTSVMARRCQLKAGTPVAAGCGDTAASFLACGATRKGICVDVAGTASVFAATTNVFRPDLEHGVLSYGQSVTPGLWHPYAYINGGGMNLEWFQAQLGGEDDLEALDRAAAGIEPTRDAPYFIPHLGGRVNPAQPHLRGAWAGLNWSHSRADLYRAMLEGVALEYGLYRATLKQLEPRFNIAEVRVTGGGERSATWNAIKANVLGCPVTKMLKNDGAPMGAALLAAHAVGLCPDLDATAQSWARSGATAEPVRSLLPLIKQRQARYEKLLVQLNDWSE